MGPGCRTDNRSGCHRDDPGCAPLDAPMRFSLTLGSREPLTREKAWTCLSANAGFPGSGSLMAGKLSGYFQMLLTIVALLMSLVFGTRFTIWFFSNWSRLQAAGADPFQNLREVWMGIRWAVLGMGLFAFAWIWAFLTGIIILSRTKKPTKA